MEDDVRAAAAGDRRAFTRLVERHREAVCAVALGITGDVVASEDVAQDVFVGAWRSLRSLRDAEAFRAWLLESTRNRARDVVRSRVARGWAAPESALAEVADPAPSVTERIVEREDALRIEASLATLPDGDREVLVLYYRDGQRLAAVAAQLGISEEAARQRLARARRKLQVDVERRLGESLARTSPGAAFVSRVQQALPAGPPVAAGTGAAAAWIAGAAMLGVVVLVAVAVVPRGEPVVEAMPAATTGADARALAARVSAKAGHDEAAAERDANGGAARTSTQPAVERDPPSTGGGAHVGGSAPVPALPAVPMLEVRALVRFSGTAPTSKRIKKTPECGTDALVDEEVLVRERGLANVLVRVTEGAPEMTGTGQGVEITQDKCVYSPRVSGIVAGQSIAVTSRDAFLHNVHTFKGDVSIFNKGQPAPGTFTKDAADFAANGEVVRDGPITFKCDVHPWMVAHVVVNPNPYFGVTDAAGVARFQVPPGKYRLQAWHEKFGVKTLDLDTQVPVVLFEYDGNEGKSSSSP